MWHSFIKKTTSRLNSLSPIGLMLAIGLMYIALPLLTYSYTLAHGDLGEYLNNPLRILNGELPYLDFWLIFPPGEVFFPALIYKIFGLNINFVLVGSIVISAFVNLTLFVIGKQLCKSNSWAFLLSLLSFFGGITFYLSPTNLNVFILLNLLSISVFIEFFETKKKHYLFLSGLLLGFSSLFRFYEAGACALAEIGVLSYFMSHAQLSTKKIFQQILLYVSSAIPGMLIYILFFFQIGPEIINAILFDSVEHASATNTPYFSDTHFYTKEFVSSLKIFMDSGGSGYLITSFESGLKIISATLLAIFPWILIPTILFILFKKKLFTRSHFYSILLLCVWAIITVPRIFGRSDIEHFSVLLPAIFPLLLISLKTVQEKRFFRNKNVLTFSLWVLALLFFLPVLQFGISLFRVYSDPSYPIITEHGHLNTSSEERSIETNEVINFINSHSKEGDYIFVTDWFAPPFYALTNRKNPTYYDSLIDIAVNHTNEKEQQICDDLRSHDTKIIIHNDDWGFDGLEERQFNNHDNLIEECVENDFVLTETIGRYQIFLQKK